MEGNGIRRRDGMRERGNGVGVNGRRLGEGMSWKEGVMSGVGVNEDWMKEGIIGSWVGACVGWRS